MLDISEVHRTKGKIVSYVLKCDGDDERDSYYYGGVTNDFEYRMLQHTGQAPGVATWTAMHPPNQIVSVLLHATMEEALVAECGHWNLWAGRLKDYDQIRGARLNGCDPLKFPPRGWRIHAENAPE